MPGSLPQPCWSISSPMTLETLIGGFSDSAAEQLMSSHPELVESGLGDALAPKLERWRKETHAELGRIFPFTEEKRAFENALHDSLSEYVDRDMLAHDISNCGCLERFQQESWSAEIPSADEQGLRGIRSAFLSAWGDSLERRIGEWYVDALEKRRAELIISSEPWLRFIEIAMRIAGKGDGETGLLWDLQENELSITDGQRMLEWEREFRNNPALRRLCVLMGRSLFLSRNETLVQVSSKSSRSTVDRSQREEISGIETGDRIEDLLPSERGLLADPELSVLFDIKYAEKRLMCFEKQSYAEIEVFEENQTVSAANEALGPVIMCIDTSGSMEGTPETIAKAVALYISLTAHRQHRRCYLINFSVGTRSIDISPAGGIRGLMDFLSMSFHGGTDIVPAMREAMDKIGEEEYEKADILAISDFAMPPDAFDPLSSQMQRVRETGCRFYSLTVGNFPYGPRLEDIFDGCWDYDASAGKIGQR